MAAIPLEAAINTQKNIPEMMRKKQEQQQLSDITKEVEQ
jgi:hypothetical protein